MGYYPAFPPAMPRSGVGCIRVTHPCATLVSRRTLTVRLACIRPAASVHPEPGSNSSLYYCTTKFCFLKLQGSLCVLSVSLPYRRPASRQMRLDFLMLAFKLSKNSRKLPSFFNPPFLSFAGAKVLHFPLPPTTIFTFFQTFSIRAECQQDKFHVFCNNCCRKAVFWRKTRLSGASRGPDPAVFCAFLHASGAFLAEIRPRFTAFNAVARRHGTDSPRDFFGGHLIIYRCLQMSTPKLFSQFSSNKNRTFSKNIRQNIAISAFFLFLQ